MDDRPMETVQDLSLIARSKKELYNVLVRDSEIYMPPIKEANAKYIRKIVSGKAKVRLLCCNSTIVFIHKRCESHSGSAN
jgi:hypothetical protein